MHMGDPDENPGLEIELKDQKKYYFYRKWKKSDFKQDNTS